MVRFPHVGTFGEIGQAIGNVGGRLLGMGKARAELVDSILKRRLSEHVMLPPPSPKENWRLGDEEVIDASYRVLEEKEEL